MKKNLIGLLAIAGLALTGCSDNDITKVKIFCSAGVACSKCEPLKQMYLDDYNIISLECESLVSDSYHPHYHYILTYRE